MSDLALARRLLAGDETALEEFFQDYFPRLYRFACVRLAGNDDAAEEVVQAAMTKAIEKLHTYRGEAAMFTWLCAVCRREISTWQERTGTRAEITLREDEPRTRATLDALAALTGSDPETELHRREISRLVQVTLDHLPGRYADALEWRYMQGLSVDEIAARLAATPGRFDRRRDDDMIDDEETTARLLRFAGPRPAVPAERAARVQEAITLRWRATMRRRLRRQRVAKVAVLLAAAATIILIARFRAPDDSAVAPGGRSVALVERIEGPVGRISPGQAGNDARSRLAAGDRLVEGDWVETPATARAALQLTSGVSLRVDTGARIRLVSERTIELALGALYVDTGADGAALEVATPFGMAHDIGTQFEIRLERASLRLRVRTGLVELRRESQTIAVQPGTELVVTADDSVNRHAAPFGPEWEWAARLAPNLDIEGQRLGSYLSQMCREQGWTLRYDDERLARDAAGIILNGSVRGLAPPDAVAVAVRISGLAHRLQDGELMIMRPPETTR
jgi:RNA polymerase sigma-70 factor (ECF subfamily)